MKNYLSFFASLLLIATLSSCDDGRIYEKTVTAQAEGRVLKLTGTLAKTNSWSNGYNLVIAGFNSESEYAVISKNLPSSIEDGDHFELIMPGIKEDVEEVELCVINRLRKRIITYHKIEDIQTASDTIYMTVNNLDVSMYQAIQSEIFDANCVNCHGRSTSAAAGLFLTADRSYDALVNKSSNVNNEMLLVNPGNAQQSFLHLILNENGHIAHDHVDILSVKTELLTLIDNWINNGAEE